MLGVSIPPTGFHQESVVFLFCFFLAGGAEACCIDTKIKEHVSGRTYRGNSMKGGGSGD